MVNFYWFVGLRKLCFAGFLFLLVCWATETLLRWFPFLIGGLLGRFCVGVVFWFVFCFLSTSTRANTFQYFKDALFWALFAVAYALLIVCVGIEFYYKGMWSIYRDATSTVDRWRRRIVGDGKSQ